MKLLYQATWGILTWKENGFGLRFELSAQEAAYLGTVFELAASGPGIFFVHARTFAAFLNLRKALVFPLFEAGRLHHLLELKVL